MAFDKYYPNRKDKRKPFYKSKRFDRSCRCHGGCPYCEGNRMYSTIKRKQDSDLKLKQFKINGHKED